MRVLKKKYVPLHDGIFYIFAKIDVKKLPNQKRKNWVIFQIKSGLLVQKTKILKFVGTLRVK